MSQTMNEEMIKDIMHYVERKHGIADIVIMLDDGKGHGACAVHATSKEFYMRLPQLIERLEKSIAEEVTDIKKDTLHAFIRDILPPDVHELIINGLADKDKSAEQVANEIITKMKSH